MVLAMYVMCKLETSHHLDSWSILIGLHRRYAEAALASDWAAVCVAS